MSTTRCSYWIRKKKKNTKIKEEITLLEMISFIFKIIKMFYECFLIFKLTQ